MHPAPPLAHPPTPPPARRPGRRALLSGFTKTVVIPLILLMAGVEIGMKIGHRTTGWGTGWAGFSKGAAREGSLKPTCELSGSFSRNIYPSLILSMGAAYPEYTRYLRIVIHGAESGGTVRLRVESPLFLEPLVCSCESSGQDIVLNPTLPWNYDALRHSNQVHTEAFVATLEVNGLADDQETLSCQVHSVNEAVTRLYDDGTNQWVDTTVCFAAFVNEDHPLINQLLQEALARGEIKAFTGYQNGPQAVLLQMQAVWDALAARGLNYVNLATDSSASSDVSTQYVRFLDQAVRDEGANCVDASALFAAVFRRIGLRSVLLFKPGHCFVGVYDAQEGGHIVALETTLLGSSSFASAEAAGSQELLDTLPYVGNPHYAVLEIGLARKQGVNPIPYDDTDSVAADPSTSADTAAGSPSGADAGPGGDSASQPSDAPQASDAPRAGDGPSGSGGQAQPPPGN